ncbi:MAG: c-type cytochrome [Candidatus Acidiferrales bacterium]
MRGFLVGIIFAVILIFAGGYYLLKQGYVDFSADHEPSHAEMHLAMAAVDASTDRNAPEVKNPLTANEDTLVAGAKLFMDHCAGCHGLPSNPDSQFGRSFNPPVPQFFKEAPDMAENQNFYIIQHGVRWSGMPAWSGTLNDTQTWQLVTFLSNTEKLPPAAQKELEPAATTAAAPAPAPAATKR